MKSIHSFLIDQRIGYLFNCLLLGSMDAPIKQHKGQRTLRRETFTKWDEFVQLTNELHCHAFYAFTDSCIP